MDSTRQNITTSTSAERSHTWESALRASIVSSQRLKGLKRERRRPYNIPRFNVLSRRLETMEARSAESRVFLLLFCGWGYLVFVYLYKEAQERVKYTSGM
jgi:hypothetical protein